MRVSWKRQSDNLVILLLALALWQGLYAYAGDVAITPPWQTLRYTAHLLGDRSFWPNVQATMLAFLYALVISAIGYVIWRRSPRQSARHAAEQTLAERYARGEIDELELRERRSHLREKR